MKLLLQLGFISLTLFFSACGGSNSSSNKENTSTQIAAVIDTVEPKSNVKEQKGFNDNSKLASTPNLPHTTSNPTDNLEVK